MDLETERVGLQAQFAGNSYFEELPSLEQALTFQAAAGAFKKYGAEFGPEKYRALGLTKSNDGLFTNLALLLSDQCPHTTKVAVFSDEADTVFKDSRDFGGSVFQQLEEAFTYLSLCNKTKVVFKGLERIEKPDYPEEALREALLNALVHRDYSFSGSIIINVNEERLEFISLGGLLPGLSLDDIRLGISQPRNKNLAAIFHRLRLIESYGTGIRRIYRLYQGCPVQPELKATNNAFRLTLPNMNAAADGGLEQASPLTPQLEKVLAYIARQGQITDEELQSLLGVKKTRAFELIKELRARGLVQTVGRGAAKRYLAK